MAEDNAIMEFYPAHVAYQRAPVTGFRTFIRVNGKYAEPFSDPDVPHEMHIRMNSLEILEEDQKTGLRTNARYFILPEENYGALVRRVEIKNNSGQEISLEIADGMPALIPYGVDNETMKEMAQLAKAWMQVEDAEEGRPYYRVRASMADTARIEEVKGGNFSLGLDETGEALPVVVDARVLFGYDTALREARVFKEEGLYGVFSRKQAFSNQLPCAFFTTQKNLKDGESIVLYELYGHTDSKEKLREISDGRLTPAWLEEKSILAEEITDSLGGIIDTHTGNPDFDAYSRYTYMDNVLRGGYPVEKGGKIFYIYSRKHGDLEREYNFFSMSPEPCSQGNGNFRDVNQNRRCDPFYTPQCGRRNIRLFYDMIQPDGYNPLNVEKITYRVDEKEIAGLVEELAMLDEEGKTALSSFLRSSFTPGALYMKIREVMRKVSASELLTEGVFEKILAASDEQPGASFKEGYWSDHWTYNLDLIEEYLGIWPEQEEELLTEKIYTWYKPEAYVNPRSERYAETPDGIRQYHAVTEDKNAVSGQSITVNGLPFTSSLLEKLAVLCTIKTATLDPLGMGVEMEGGKPGWYDALNGLPGLLGSSMNESCELARMLRFTISALKKYPGKVEIYAEAAKLMEEAAGIIKACPGTDKKNLIARWNDLNDAKEAYREKVYKGFSGKTAVYDRAALAEQLLIFLQAVEDGISRSIAESAGGIIPTYFYYEVTDYTKDEQGIHIRDVVQKNVPDYLEGPVRYLKLPVPQEQKKQLYEKVKKSDLYDRKLSMYKVNASLKDASYEIGRVKCFTPGWLENESIWLHMEYKYLLELLRSGLYGEFAEDFHRAGIPFLDEEIYGRSILENSSFIVSSANPDENLHGRGFVARLSGSTAEFLSIWQIMMFGASPFKMKDGTLLAEFSPVIPAYLIGEERTVTARFMGHTPVTYHFDEKRDYFPGEYRIEKTVLTKKTPKNSTETFPGGVLAGNAAVSLRSGKFEKVDIYILAE